MELHHKMHHQTYVNSYNTAFEQLQTAESKQDIAAAIALQPVINFHGGGHLNHTLFWENLAPKNQGGGGEPEGKLKVGIVITHTINDGSKISRLCYKYNANLLVTDSNRNLLRLLL
jgi:superoxide dismutase